MLHGNAFMIMWHDITPEADDEYHHWHTKQHMPERLGHRGFLRSRRGVNWDIDRQRYFTLYEGEALETFVSEDYLASLNGPTEWTNRMAPHFRNFLRCACEVKYSVGRGLGGALVTFRGRLPSGLDEDAFAKALRPQFETLLGEPKITAAHLAFARPEFSDLHTRETALRPKMSEDEFDFVAIVESFGLRELARIEPEIRSRLQRAGNCEVMSQSYGIAYTLEKD